MWVTGELARFVTDLTFDQIPKEEVQAVRKVLLDYLGCGIAGTAAQSSEIGGKEEGSIFGSPVKIPAANAVFLNSTMAHSHDFDDTHDKAFIHPGVLVIPAALAIAEQREVDCKSFITALVAGYEVHTRIALGSNVGPNSGWVLTSTCGIFGAAAAVGKLLELGHNQMVNALGIAHCMSSGNSQTIKDGVLSKRLQVGHASSMGVLSALLAHKGFTGAHNAFDGTFSFHKVYFRDYELLKVTKDLGKRFEIANVSFKPYPCCRFTHSSADAMFKLVEQHKLEPDDVCKIEIRVTKQVKVMVCEPEEKKKKPETVVDAQFSIPYVVASILVNKHLFVDEFTETSIRNPKILETSAKVQCLVDEELDRLAGRELAPVIVTVETNVGDRYYQRVDRARGHPKNPMSEKDLMEKFMANAAKLLPDKNIRGICSAIGNIEQLKDFKNIMTLMHG
jgi:2-methylcitrate dehydratase PrpD